MQFLGETLFELLFEILIVDVFGRGTIKLWYRLTGNTKGLQRLKNSRADSSSTGCLVPMVGFVSFGIFFAGMVWLISHLV